MKRNNEMNNTLGSLLNTPMRANEGKYFVYLKINFNWSIVDNNNLKRAMLRQGSGDPN